MVNMTFRGVWRLGQSEPCPEDGSLDEQTGHTTAAPPPFPTLSCCCSGLDGGKRLWVSNLTVGMPEPSSNSGRKRLRILLQLGLSL